MPFCFVTYLLIYVTTFVLLLEHFGNLMCDLPHGNELVAVHFSAFVNNFCQH